MTEAVFEEKVSSTRKSEEEADALSLPSPAGQGSSRSAPVWKRAFGVGAENEGYESTTKRAMLSRHLMMIGE